MERLEDYLKSIKEYLGNMVAVMLPQELPILTEEKFALFEKTGNRLVYERDYFAKRKFLTVFGVAVQWMRQERLERLGQVWKHDAIKKLEEILVAICEEECWALPAHVNRSVDKNWRKTIDLFAAETAQTLMDITDAVGDGLSSQCIELVRKNVQIRVLQPFFESSRGTYGWERCENNWNAVCNGNIGSAYLHSLKKSEIPNQQYLDRICENLKHYFDGFAEDGTCMEGLSYYFYGMTYMTNFARELYCFTDGSIDLLQGDWGDFVAGAEDKRGQVTVWWSKCFWASGRTVSFSDSDSREKYRMGLACALAERLGSVRFPDSKYAMMLEEDSCYRYLPFKMDVFCTMEYLVKLQNRREQKQKGSMTEVEVSIRGLATTLHDAQWCIAESADAMVGFACKGGHNGEPHNHNDVGSFLYVIGEEMFLTDLGAGEYIADYFGKGRYKILCNRSLGHNVPIIAGKEQSVGADYRCKEFEVLENWNTVDIKMDLTMTYEVSQLKSYVRHISFNKMTGDLLIEDTFEATEEIQVTENLITQYLPQIERNEICLIGKTDKCLIRIGMSGDEIPHSPRMIPMKHSNHQGWSEQVYLVQWERHVEKYAKEIFRVNKKDM